MEFDDADGLEARSDGARENKTQQQLEFERLIDSTFFLQGKINDLTNKVYVQVVRYSAQYVQRDNN